MAIDCARLATLANALTLAASEMAARADRGEVEADWLFVHGQKCTKLAAQIMAHGLNAVNQPDVDAERRDYNLDT